MAYTTIKKPSDYFNTKLYTGTGSSNSITGVGFEPDWVWIKEREDTVSSHATFDIVRGAEKRLLPNLTNAENTDAQTLSSFDSDGFTLGTQGGVNASGNTYASWNWLANGSGSANTDGSISSTVSANTTAGFSIVSWTGSGADATVGHGLNSAPTIYIVKNRTDVSDWRVGQVLTSSNNMTDGNGYYMELNDTKASSNPGSATTWGATPTAPTSSVFTVGSNNSHNGSGDDMIAYCFHSVQGYSKFGSYTGNANADGTFIYTGFKPAFFITKNTTTGASNWMMYDNKRDPDNQMAEYLYANTNGDSGTNAQGMDFLSNGIKMRNTFGDANSSDTFIYMAFAEEPLVGDNPATAR